MTEGLKPWEIAAKELSKSDLKPWEQAALELEKPEKQSKKFTGTFEQKVTSPTPLTEKGRQTFKYSEEKPLNFDKALKAVTKIKEKAQMAYYEDPSIAANQLRKEEEDNRANYEKLYNEVSLSESLTNTANNISVNLQKLLPQTQLAATDVWENILGKDLAKQFYQFEGRDINAVRSQAYDNLAQLESQIKQVKGNFADNIKYLKGEGLLANTAEAIGSLVTTALPALVSKGSLTAVSQAGQTIADYNRAKAESRGETIEQLYNREEADVAVPLSLSALSTSLELIGLKGVQNSINRKLTGSVAKKAALLLTDVNTEGLTELIQTGIEGANKAAAKGENAADGFREATFSKDGLNAYLGGLFASTGAAGIGRVSQFITKPSNQEQANNIISELSDIEQDLTNTNVTDEVKETILKNAETKLNDLATIVNEDIDSTDTQSPETKQEVNQVQGEIDTLTQVVEDPNVSETSKATAQTQIDEQVEQLNNLQENVQEAETQTEEDLLIEDEVPLPTPTRLQEIQSKRQEIKDRISEKFRQQRGQLNAGIDPTLLKDYVELGANYIEEGIVRFSDFAKKIKEDLPDIDLKDKDIREIFTQAASEKGFKVRGFSESVKNAKNLSEETKATVEDLNTLYEVQNYDEIYDRLGNTSEVDKVKAVKDLEKVTESLTPKDNVGVLAGIQLINQYNAEGKSEQAKSIIDSLMKVGTVAAQTLRQFAELKKSTVDGFLQIINSRLEKSGKKLTPEQEVKVKQLWNIIKANNEAKIKAEETLYNTLDKKDRKAVRDATVQLEDAQRELDDYIGEIKGSDIYDTLSSVLQGNLLTLKSVVQNPISNTVQALVDNYENLLSIPVDMALSLYTKQRSRFTRISKGNLRNQQFAIADGMRLSLRKALKGSTSTELSKYDTGNRLRPFEAVKRLLYKSKRGDKYSTEQALSDFFEGVPGQFANFFFRMLPFGDDVFTAFGRQNELDRIAKSKGLEGKAYDRFILNPDPKSAELADRSSKKLTFQEDNNITKVFNFLRNLAEDSTNRHARGFAKLALKGIAPFVKTPSSVALKTLDFAVPVFPLYRFFRDLNKLHTAKKGKASAETINQLQSKTSLALATTIIAVTANQVAQYIVSNALATGSSPDDPRDKKKKDFMYLTQPPNTINISGLQRLLNGQDAKYQQNDKVASYNALGVLGAVIGITENTRGKALRELERKKKTKTTSGEDFYDLDDSEKGAVNDYITGLFSNFGASGQFLMDQSFLQGTSTVVEAMAKGDFKDIIPQYAKTLSNIGIPNQIVQGLRTSDKELRDLYTEDTWETTVNVLKERYQGIDDLPKKINMWGQTIKSTPEGENPIVFQVFDLFRTQRILKDQTTYKIFDILKKTNDESVLPASVRDSYQSGEFTTKLTPEEESKLAEFIGKERKIKADRVMASYNPNEITDVTQIKRVVERLEKAYKAGAAIGKRKFKSYLKTK